MKPPSPKSIPNAAGKGPARPEKEGDGSRRRRHVLAYGAAVAFVLLLVLVAQLVRA